MAEARPLAKHSAKSRATRWAWLALVAVLLAIAAGFALDRRHSPASALDPATLRGGFGPASYADELAVAEADVAEARSLLTLGPREWLRQEQLALALIGRFRLAGDYADLVAAEGLLDEGLAEAPDPAGPVLTKAMFEVLVHRLDAADTALARFARWGIPRSEERAEAAVLAGDVAMQRGDLDGARRNYEAAESFASPLVGDIRLTMLPTLQGDPGRAIADLERIIAAPRHSPWTLANLMLRRAQLDLQRGDWAGAGRWVGAAQRAFPGWWLADAHAAQQFALAGRTAEAIRAYTIVSTRTRRPEVMDALAHLLRLEGKGAASRVWAAKAAAGWESRAALFREAVIQHRAEHELAVGRVPAALALAQADVAARPGPQGIALLARALILSGKPREALGWLDKARDAGFVSAGLLMLRADALAALGGSAASEAARDQALAINPRVADPAARLVWFGHD